eukprot:Rmarinus@m.16925
MGQKNKPSKGGKGHRAAAPKGRTGDAGIKQTISKQQSKKDRHNHAKQIMQQKQAVINDRKAIGSSGSPPKVVVIVALDDIVNTRQVRDCLIRGCDPDADTSINGPVVAISRKWKQRFVFLDVPREEYAVMDGAKIADCFVFAMRAGEGIDPIGHESARIIRAQGSGPVFGVVRGIEEIHVKKRHDYYKLFKQTLEEEFSQECKVMSVDSESETSMALRALTAQAVKPPAWRDHHAYMLCDAMAACPDNGIIKLRGYLRGRNASPNQLVHITGHGTYRLASIQTVQEPCPFGGTRKKNTMAMGDDGQHQTWLPDESQESLEWQNTPDPMANDQTWPTEDEIREAEETRKSLMQKAFTQNKGTVQADTVDDAGPSQTNKKLKKMKGVSEHLAAWLEKEGAASDASDVEDDAMMDEEGDGTTEGRLEGDDEGDDDGMGVGEEEEAVDTAAELQRLKQLRKSEKEDEEFPDEVDTPFDTPARERFQRYRGLKSFRTSPWDPFESLPLDYARIFRFQSFSQVKNVALAQDANYAVTAGTYVELTLRGVPDETRAALVQSATPVIASFLHTFEHKVSVVHFGLQARADLSRPVRSKEELVFSCGFRRFVCKPIFYQISANCDKHKYERFLHPSRFSGACVYGPIAFPPAPLLVFRRNERSRYDFIARGSLQTVDPMRVILKRIVLSGYPFKVQKKRAVVRFMFHNPDDIRWFKPVELYTKHGRQGHIRMPIGTHGYMKCVFDGTITHHDTVCMALYKRVFPKEIGLSYDPATTSLEAPPVDPGPVTMDDM